MLRAVPFLCLFHIIYAYYTITLYGDVFKDRKFFTTTFPWIIDNIGGELKVDYHLLGSGRYSVPQMCALLELNDNTFLQAQYLKCEAENKPSRYCLCETGIDPKTFKACVRENGNLAAEAAEKLARLKIGTTPLIEISPKSTVFEVTDNWYLKKICTIFGDYPPLGCVRPFACNSTELVFERKAIAQFDINCDYLDDPTPVTVTTTTASPSAFTTIQEENVSTLLR